MKRKINIKLSEGGQLVLTTTIGIFLFMLIMPTVVIATKDTNLNHSIESKEVVTEFITETIGIEGDGMVNVYRVNTGVVEEIELEEYLSGVVSNEMPANFEEEALKSQAVAARTYFISKMTQSCDKSVEADVCDSTHCQVYTSEEERMGNWNEDDADDNWSKIENAVKATEGQVLTYENEIVMYPQFFSTSSGQTENSEDIGWSEVPYLRSVESLGEDVAPKFETEKVISTAEFISTITGEYNDININNIEEDIKIISRSEAGSIKEISVGGVVIEGLDFRMALELNSSNFTYEISDENIIFTCKGYGHGVGMSQWGANIMAGNGASYNEILEHYYTGIEIKILEFE